MDSVFGDSRSGLATQPPQLTGRSRGSQNSVPRHIGLIEPWIGGSLAVCTAWLFAVGHREQPVIWVYIIGAIVLALWSWRRPARRQSSMMIRGVLFAVMGLGVASQIVRIDTMPVADFFFWISVPAIFYAFLLRASLAWWLLGINFFFAVAALLFSVSDEVLLVPFVGRAGLLAVFGAAAIRMGAVLRRTDELLEARRVDAASGMLNEYGFVDYGAELWTDCRTASVPATLVYLDVPDLGRLRTLYGAGTARRAVDRVLGLMQGLGTGRNLVGRLTSSRFALLMPGATREQAMEFLGERLGRPPQIEMDEDDLELMFLVNIHAAESRMQNVSFSRFFEAEHEMLDFYFSDRRDAGRPHDEQAVQTGREMQAAQALQAAQSADGSGTRGPVMRPEPLSHWNQADHQPPPSTLPVGPP